MIETLRWDCGSAGGRNSVWIVALRALQRCMLALQRISRLRVVELVCATGPANQIEITAGMLGVTTRAIHLAARAAEHLRVETGFVIEPILDVHMARKTFQSRRARPECMTIRTTQHAFQIRVGLRQRPGRHLRHHGRRPEHEHQSYSSTHRHLVQSVGGGPKVQGRQKN